jgi:predicted nuclease of predicted toxin-antitoxin system
MKLLFDQNPSPSLISRVADLFPESDHVSLLGMDTATDEEVWNFAQRHYPGQQGR